MKFYEKILFLRWVSNPCPPGERVRRYPRGDGGQLILFQNINREMNIKNRVRFFMDCSPIHKK